jgi:hypothetical protein
MGHSLPVAPRQFDLILDDTQRHTISGHDACERQAVLRALARLLIEASGVAKPEVTDHDALLPAAFAAAAGSPETIMAAKVSLYELSQGRSADVGGQPWGDLGCRDRPLLANPIMSAGTG